MDQFKSVEEVMRTWKKDIHALVRYIVKHRLPVYNAVFEEPVDTEDWPPGAVFYNLSVNNFIFKLSDLEAFAKEHGLPSFYESERPGGGKPTEAAQATPTLSLTHSPDFRSWNKSGEVFSLTEKQAQITKILWDAFQKRTPMSDRNISSRKFPVQRVTRG